MNTFISYSRHSAAVTEPLAEDIRALGHSAWYDQELGGGQAWWAQILEKIRGCDVFVFVLDPASLNSTACAREWNYASALGKPILPVLVSDEVSTNLLPPALSQIQFVDYRTQDRDAAIRLARSFATLPPAGPLPDPLPTPPETPVSYLGSLTAQVGTAATLTYEEQCGLLTDLRRSLRDPETANDARTLLVTLRHRRELFASVAEEIDDLLGTHEPPPAAAPPVSAGPVQQPEPTPVQPPVPPEPVSQPEQVQQPAPTPTPLPVAPPDQAPVQAAPAQYAPQYAPTPTTQMPTPPAPGGPPAKRSKKGPVIAVVIVAAVLLVGCVGAVIGLGLLGSQSESETAASEMVDQFFSLLLAGEYDSASQGFLSGDLADQYTAEALQELNYDATSGSVEILSATEQDSGDVVVDCTITWDDGETKDFTMTCTHLGDDPSDWEQWYITGWQ